MAKAMDIEQIDAEARRLAGPAWVAMDERDRLPYRIQAVNKLRENPNPSVPVDEHCASEPPR
jgi:hypothetical protein